MIHESLIIGNYVLNIENNGVVRAAQSMDNIFSTAVKIAKNAGIEIDNSWDADECFSALWRGRGNGVTYGEYTLIRYFDWGDKIYKHISAQEALTAVFENSTVPYDCNEDGNTWKYNIKSQLFFTIDGGKIKFAEDGNPIEHFKSFLKKYKIPYERTWCLDIFLNRPSTEKINVNSGISWNDLKAVKNGDKCGYVDANGSEIIPCMYDTTRYLGRYRDYCEVSINDKYGFIDINNNLVLPAEYDLAEYKARPNCFLVGTEYKRDCLYGIVSIDGKIIIPQEYDRITWDNDRCAFYVEKNGKKGIISIDGDVIDELQ